MVARWYRLLTQALLRYFGLRRESGEHSTDENNTLHHGEISDVKIHFPSENNTNTNLNLRVINVPQHADIEAITIITIYQEHASRVVMNGVLCDHIV